MESRTIYVCSFLCLFVGASFGSSSENSTASISVRQKDPILYGLGVVSTNDQKVFSYIITIDPSSGDTQQEGGLLSYNSNLYCLSAFGLYQYGSTTYTVEFIVTTSSLLVVSTDGAILSNTPLGGDYNTELHAINFVYDSSTSRLLCIFRNNTFSYTFGWIYPQTAEVSLRAILEDTRSISPCISDYDFNQGIYYTSKNGSDVVGYFVTDGGIAGGYEFPNDQQYIVAIEVMLAGGNLFAVTNDVSSPTSYLWFCSYDANGNLQCNDLVTAYPTSYIGLFEYDVYFDQTSGYFYTLLYSSVNDDARVFVVNTVNGQMVYDTQVDLSSWEAGVYSLNYLLNP